MDARKYLMKVHFAIYYSYIAIKALYFAKMNSIQRCQASYTVKGILEKKKGI